jgi:hypothetical protein
LPSVSLLGVPSWTAEGPAPNTNGQDENVPAEPGGGPNEVSGAVEALAVNPGNANQVFAGSVNGGIWKTNSILAATTAWTPLTDQFPALEISSIQFDPTDATNNTLVAGIGNLSSQFSVLGPLTGLLKSTDDGTTWTQLGNAPLASGGLQGEVVSSVLPRGNTILVGVRRSSPGSNVFSPSPGLFRSTNGGQSFQNISGLNMLGNGQVFDVAGDPSNTNRAYVVVGGATGGVFRTDDLGNTWTPISNAAITALLSGAVSNAKLSVSAAAPNPVYLAIADSGRLSGVFWSSNLGVAWTAMDLPQTPDSDSAGGASPQGINPGRQAATHLALAADPSNANLVYIGGDRQPDNEFGNPNPGAPFPANSVGATNYSARIFRADRSVAPTGAVPSPQWTPLTNNGTSNNSSPHADSRAFAFGSGNTLVYSGDGGIFNESDRTTTAGKWFSDNGAPNGANNGIQVTQFATAIAYDSNSNIIFGGAQDTGTPQQSAAGSMVYQDQTQADGPFTAVDDLTTPGGNSHRYIGFTRNDYSNANASLGSVNLFPAGGINGGFTGFTALAVSTVAPAAGNATRIVAFNGGNPGPGGTALFLSDNAGTAATTGAIVYTQITPGAGWGGVNQINGSGNGNAGDFAISVGGMLGGVANQDVIYAASGNQVFLRSAASGAGATLTATTGQPAGAGTIQSISVDPNNWMTAYVTDGSRIFMTTTAGADPDGAGPLTGWTDITGNLVDNNIHTLTVVDGTGANAGVTAVLAGETNGVFRMLTSVPNVWTKFGANFPNSSVWGVQYSTVSGGTLVAGTSGRGAFEVQNAATSLFAPGVLQINGDTDFPGEDDTIKLVLDPINPLILDVFLNSATPTTQVPLAVLQQINVNGLGGNDTLIVDSSNGLINVPLGMRYDGGTGFNILQLVQTDGTTQSTDVYSPGPNAGQGTDVITGPGGTQTVFFQNLAPVLDTVPATTLIVNGTPANNAISYQVGSVVANGLVSVDNFEPIEFSNKANLSINSGAGVDTVSLNNPNTPTGLAAISVAGGDPTSFDTLIVNGTGTVNVATDTNSITGAGPVSISYATIESLIVNAGNNNLTVSGSNTYTYTPGAAADAGTVQTVTLPIAFTGVGSGKTLTLTGSGGGATVTANGTNGNDSFTLASTTGALTLGDALSGRATIAPTSIANLIVNGLDGDDVFSVTGPQPYTNITLAGGDPSASDVANVTGNGTAVVAHLGGTTASVTGGGLGNVLLPGIEVLNLNAGAGNITLAGTPGPDAFTVTPTGATTATAQVGTLSPVVNTTNTGTLTVDADGGSDTLTVNGTSAGDTINVSGAAVTVVGLQPVNFVNVESLAVNGLAGSDIFNVTSSATVPISIDGGDPVGVLPGDQLNVVTVPGDTVNLFPGPTSDSGGVVVNSNQPISYIHIESLTITGGGSPVINGTNGNDVITIIARDSSYTPGLDGIQDFTVSVNAGPNILFIDTPSLMVHALAGDDQIVVQAPAPNLAAWNVALTLDGGPSSALGDQLVVSTPGANQATYTPGTANSGTLGITNSNGNVSNVTITDIENFVYDGQAGGDSLKMVGTSAANAFTLTPGATNDAGMLSMDSVLPVNFQNLGAGGQVVVDGNGGADTLTYSGTPANDTFVVNNSALGGQINLNARVPLLTANISNVSLLGLGGDDTFTLVPTILSGPYLMLHLVGGPPASATGSQANLKATAGTPITLSGQTITQGAFTVAGSGLQNENLDGAGNDTTYNSVVGVTENINVIASPTANQGQVSVPGVAQWTFTSVPIIYVNGTLADNDTVTFTGTNNNDVYQANLAAAGTDGDPVLKLQTPTGATLLTLANYTGFQTLNIAGLDGADVFNVSVAPTGPGRQIFINGDLPSGKKKLTDLLNVFYVNKPHPKVIHSTSTQDPDAGLVSVNYGTGLPSFLIQFDGIENVTIHQQ